MDDPLPVVRCTHISDIYNSETIRQPSSLQNKSAVNSQSQESKLKKIAVGQLSC